MRRRGAVLFLGVLILGFRVLGFCGSGLGCLWVVGETGAFTCGLGPRGGLKLARHCEASPSSPLSVRCCGVVVPRSGPRSYRVERLRLRDL